MYGRKIASEAQESLTLSQLPLEGDFFKRRRIQTDFKGPIKIFQDCSSS